jgi:hypothetical protein
MLMTRNVLPQIAPHAANPIHGRVSGEALTAHVYHRLDRRAIGDAKWLAVVRLVPE